MIELSPAVAAEIHAIQPREAYESYTIPTSLRTLRDFISTRAGEAECRPDPNLGLSLDGLRDHAFLAAVIRDCQQWLRFYYLSAMRRASLYADEVAAGFNERAFIRVPLATRALFELFLYTFYVYHTVYQRQKALKEMSPAKQAAWLRDTDQGLMQRDFLMKQAGATRVNWDDPLGPTWQAVGDAVRQTNIVTVLEKLPGDYRTLAERWYAFLSDACHPNFGSTLLVLDHDRCEPGSPPLVAFADRPTVAHLRLTIDLTTAPFGFACVRLVGFFRALEDLLAHYADGLARFGGR